MGEIKPGCTKFGSLACLTNEAGGPIIAVAAGIFLGEALQPMSTFAARCGTGMSIAPALEAVLSKVMLPLSHRTTEQLLISFGAWLHGAALESDVLWVADPGFNPDVELPVADLLHRIYEQAGVDVSLGLVTLDDLWLASGIEGRTPEDRMREDFAKDGSPLNVATKRAGLARLIHRQIDFEGGE